MIFTKYTFNGDGYCVQEIKTSDQPKRHGEDYWCYETIIPYEMYPGDIESYSTELFVPIDNNVILDDDYGVFLSAIFKDNALTGYGEIDNGGTKIIVLKGTEEETRKQAIDLYNKFLIAYIEYLSNKIKKFANKINPKRKELSDIYEENPNTI